MWRFIRSITTPGHKIHKWADKQYMSGDFNHHVYMISIAIIYIGIISYFVRDIIINWPDFIDAQEWIGMIVVVIVGYIISLFIGAVVAAVAEGALGALTFLLYPFESLHETADKAIQKESRARRNARRYDEKAWDTEWNSRDARERWSRSRENAWGNSRRFQNTNGNKKSGFKKLFGKKWNPEYSESYPNFFRDEKAGKKFRQGVQLSSDPDWLETSDGYAWMVEDKRYWDWLLSKGRIHQLDFDRHLLRACRKSQIMSDFYKQSDPQNWNRLFGHRYSTEDTQHNSSEQRNYSSQDRNREKQESGRTSENSRSSAQSSQSQNTNDGWFPNSHKDYTHEAYTEALKFFAMKYPYTEEELKKRRTKLIQIYHPDSCGGSDEMAKKVNVSFDLLNYFLKSR